MIVLCPQAFAGKELTLERNFLIYYFSEVGNKGVIADEVWDAFRYRITQKYPQNANKVIASRRGSFRPENFRINPKNFEEVEPKDYDDGDMCNKTRNLLERRWAEVELFITQEPSKYSDLEYKPKTITLQEFLAECMGDLNKRVIVENFFHREVFHKFE